MQQRGTGVIDCAAALFEARFTTVTNKVVAPATANHVCLPAVAPATFCPPPPHTHTPTGQDIHPWPRQAHHCCGRDV